MSSRDKLKRYQKAKFENFKKVNELKLNDDEAYIDLKLDDFKSIISTYSLSVNPILKEDFLSFIENYASYIPLDYPLVLEIHSKKIGAEDRILLRKLIKNHFSLMKINKEVELKALRRKSFFFLVMGVICFVILALAISYNILGFMKEILSFIASFSIWEFGELYLFEQDNLKEQVLKYSHLAKIRIVYNKDDR